MRDRILRRLAIGMARMAMRVEVIGDVPATGPALLAANHSSRILDPIVLASLFGQRIKFLTGADLLDTPILGRLFGSGFSIRVEDDLTGLFAAADEAIAAARQHYFLAVFPEGRDPRGGRGRYQHGASWLALRLGCPIVPVFIERTGFWRWRVRFGSSLRAEGTRVNSRTTRELTERIREAILCLGTSGRIRTTILQVAVAPGSRLGLDLVAADRLARSVRASGKGFLAELFTDAELRQLEAGVGRTAEERFAIKEAVHKALHTRPLSAGAILAIDTSPADLVRLHDIPDRKVDVLTCLRRSEHSLAVVCVGPNRRT